MKHSELDSWRHLIEQRNQGYFGAVEFPVAGEDAPILVAVRIAQHDVLLRSAAPDHLCHARQCIKLAHDGRRIAQVFNRFKERHHDEVIDSGGVERATHQPGLFLKQQRLQQITDRFCVADDVVANALRTILLQHAPGSFENFNFALGQRRVVGAQDAN